MKEQVIALQAAGGEILPYNHKNQDKEISQLYWEEPLAKKCFWHSSAHILAAAILEHYPEARPVVGPPIEEGFYYDFDFGERGFDTQSISQIEATFLKIAQQGHSFDEKVISRNTAKRLFSDNPYKLEIIDRIDESEEIKTYESGEFEDLCRGPHIGTYSNIIRSFKIINIAGSQWNRGSKINNLTRIYGISFPSQAQMESYVEQKEAVKLYDHRVVGENLRLFTFSERVGSGLPLWLPAGFEVRNQLQNMMMQIQKQLDYQYIITPHLAKSELYKVSGHYEKYKDSSFSEFTGPGEKETFMLKPMNCPHHAEVYKAFPKSYKELPLRLAENGNVCRYEPSGTLHGLTRVRAFCQDDAHIFCTREQLGNEIRHVIELVRTVFKILGFNNYRADISVRDPHNLSKYIGESEAWDRAEKDLIDAANVTGLPYQIVPGEAAFYGPKIDIQLKDSMNRSWQLSTIQVDYQLPQRFDLTYIGPDNQEHRPVMIHRAIFGSYERLLSILIEHYKGRLPLWLAPTQVRILTIGQHQSLLQYAKNIEQSLTNANVRVDTDYTKERVSKKVLKAEKAKTPLIIVIGKKEARSATLSLRQKDKQMEELISIQDLIELIHNKVKLWQ